MKQFLKALSRFALPGILIITAVFASYFYFDPFKVIRSYNDYSYTSIITNRDYISTTMFVKNNKKYGYNSFVFGSSRALAFTPNSWLRYLSADDKPFMFDASGESIYGIDTKLKYLNSVHATIKNVLIVLCKDVSFRNSKNHEGHLFIKHPLTSGESELNFHAEFLKAYLNPKFLFNFYSYQILGEYKPFMADYIENRKLVMDTITNEVTIIDQEAEISQDPDAYYLKRKELFYERKGEQTDSVQRINHSQLIMLEEIKGILEENKTNYRVVISPLYDQVKFSPDDMRILKNVFGVHLFDFSGKNKFTDSITNYFETSHYRPAVGDSILKIIYY